MLLFALGCAHLSNTAQALDPGKSLHQFNCQSWSKHHGLPSSGINAIVQCEEGYLWLGGRYGLVRFDGDRFTLIPFPDPSLLRNSDVIALARRKGGGVWVAFKNAGYCAYHDGKWQLSEETKTRSAKSTLSFHASANGKLHIGGDIGFTLLPDGREERLFEAGQSTSFISCIIEDSRGRIWLSQANGGLWFRENAVWAKNPEPELQLPMLLALAEDRDGNVWTGSDTALFKVEPNGKTTTVGYPGRVSSILADRHGVIWVATFGNGLLRIADGVWSFLRKSDGLTDDFLISLTEDHEGNIWIGTRSGLNQLTDVKLPTFGKTEGLPTDIVMGVSASPRGGFWAATSLGPWYFDGKTFSNGMKSEHPVGYTKRVLEDRHGDIYFVTGKNHIRIAAEGRVIADHPTPGMAVAMVEDAHGVVVSVAGSLYRVGRKYLTPLTFTNGVSPVLTWVLNLTHCRDGSILVSSENGLFRIRGETFERWSSSDGLLQDSVVNAIEDEDGTVWIACHRGLARIRGREVRTIGPGSGLFDPNITAIVADTNGTFWIDSNRGIYSVTRKALNDFADGRISKLDRTSYDGLGAIKPADRFQQEYVGCRTTDGRIWFPGARGAVLVDSSAIQLNNLPPNVKIESIRANGRDIPVTARASIQPGRGDLVFRFTALSYIAPQSIRFKYRLDGYDPDWLEAEDNRGAVYANLKPGNYTFQVIAANADGIWNTSGAKVVIELQPHFYQTTWFYLLCAAAVAASMAGLYAWRVSHLKSKQAALQRSRDELEREVEKRTAELAHANATLRREEEQLLQKTLSLEKEIMHRAQMQREVERISRELLGTSRLAGMAEVATSVLHNVGNVLNSVNVSSSLLQNRIERSKIPNLGRVAAMMDSHATDLGTFITTDPKGQQLPAYISKLAANLAEDQTAALEELAALQKNIGHIKEIVAMQQSYAKIAGVTETVMAVDLVEDAVRMNEGALERHAVQFVRDYDPAVTTITVDRHKVIQILVNLIRNAKYACDDSGSNEKRMAIRLTRNDGRIQISVIDNGVGIPPENLKRIFNHGFTTRKNGHGFGLHSGALAAQELGGSLTATSEGTGKGATFTLDLPEHPPKAEAKAAPVAETATAVSI